MVITIVASIGSTWFFVTYYPYFLVLPAAMVAGIILYYKLNRVSRFIKTLSHKDIWNNRSATKTLDKIHEKSLIPVLKEALYCEDEHIRSAAKEVIYRESVLDRVTCDHDILKELERCHQDYPHDLLPITELVSKRRYWIKNFVWDVEGSIRNLKKSGLVEVHRQKYGHTLGVKISGKGKDFLHRLVPVLGSFKKAKSRANKSDTEMALRIFGTIRLNPVTSSGEFGDEIASWAAQRDFEFAEGHAVDERLRALEKSASLGDKIVEIYRQFGVGYENWRVRQCAAEKLGKIGNPRAAEPLIMLLKDRCSSVREAAAKSLGQIGNESAIQALKEALNDEYEVVRIAAEDAFRKIEARSKQQN